MLLKDTFFARGLFECCQSSFTVGFDESARPELDSSEVAHHQDDDFGQSLGDKYTMYGFACRARRLSVIIGSVRLSCRSKTISPADVPGIVVLRSKLRHTS